jgi:hypothetical protein
MPGVNWEAAGDTVRYNSEVVIYCDCWISDCKLQVASCRIVSYEEMLICIIGVSSCSLK